MSSDIKRRPVRILFPDLQRSLVLLLLLSSGVSVILHVTVSAWTLTRLVSEAPNDAEQLLAAIPKFLVGDILLTLLVALPLFAILGLLTSMPLFGVLHRFRSFLEGVIAGKSEPCRLRQGDPLTEMCELLNEATEPVRQRRTRSSARRSANAEPDEVGEAA